MLLAMDSLTYQRSNDRQCSPWRQRIGPQGMQKRLNEALQTVKRRGEMTKQHLEQVNVATTSCV